MEENIPTVSPGPKYSLNLYCTSWGTMLKFYTKLIWWPSKSTFPLLYVFSVETTVLVYKIKSQNSFNYTMYILWQLKTLIIILNLLSPRAVKILWIKSFLPSDWFKSVKLKLKYYSIQVELCVHTVTNWTLVMDQWDEN